MVGVVQNLLRSFSFHAASGSAPESVPASQQILKSHITGGPYIASVLGLDRIPGGVVPIPLEIRGQGAPKSWGPHITSTPVCGRVWNYCMD